jgi:predicted nucleotidyltransferase
LPKPVFIALVAASNAGPDSDVDLIVVMDFEGPKPDTMMKLRSALPASTMPVDILATTPEDFGWRKDYVGTLEWPAFREGKVLYARA